MKGTINSSGILRNVILACGILCLSHVLNAQDFSFQKYMVRNGLAHSQATIIRQDSRGFIWICTRNGLSRFDGIEFINYYKKDGLPSNFVKQVIEDPAGDLWTDSNEGLAKYTGSGFIYYPPADSILNGRVISRAVITDEPGRIFLRCGYEIIQFENGIYKHFSRNIPSLRSLGITDMCCDTATSRILLIDSSDILWSYFDSSLHRISNVKIRMVGYENGNLTVYGSDTVLLYKDGILQPFKLTNNKGKKEVQLVPALPRYRVKYFDGSELIEFTIPFKPSNIFIDAEGTVWFPSENNIDRLKSTAFCSMEKTFSAIPNIWTICRDINGHLWLGTLEGDLYEYDGTNVTSRNEYKKLFSGYVSFYRGSRALSNGEMWLSTSNGVVIWNGKTFRKLKGLPQDCQICYIYEDPDNHKVLIGTGNGLFIYDGAISECLARFNDTDLGIVEGITKDKSGFYWLSGHKGVVKLEGSTAFRIQEDSIPRSWTYNIETDCRGGVWVSSGEGLFVRKHNDTRFKPALPEQFNIPANTLKIISDSALLVGRAGDICIIDLDRFYKGKTDYFRSYDMSDGYPGDDCLDNGILRESDGSFWILTSLNVVRFYPNRLKKNLTPPKLNFTGIFYESDARKWQPVNQNEFYFGIPSGIKFNRNQNKIKITFTGISTVNPEKVRYRFWLEGLDKTWSLPSDRREVIYENLLPGKYSFHLKSMNADNVENPVPSDLTFIISPAIYETMLFRIAFIVAIIAATTLLTWQILRRRELARKEKQRVRSELMRLQLNSVIKEFDPHFTFNAISSLGSLIMKNKREEAYSYLAKLSTILRTVIHDESIVVKSIRQEMEFVSHYLELQKLRFGERFEFMIQISENVNLDMAIPKMTVQTFVENSVKHGLEAQNQAGIINVHIVHSDNRHIFIIRDNGIGREAAGKIKKSGFGLGINTMSRIFEILNQKNRNKSKIEIRDLIEDERLTGTEVVITIPDDYSFDMDINVSDGLY